MGGGAVTAAHARTHTHRARRPSLLRPPIDQARARPPRRAAVRAGTRLRHPRKNTTASALKPRRKGESSTSGHCECVLRNGPTLAELSSRSVCARGRAGVRARRRRRIDRWEGKKKRKGGGACFSLVGWVAHHHPAPARARSHVSDCGRGRAVCVKPCGAGPAPPPGGAERPGRFPRLRGRAGTRPRPGTRGQIQTCAASRHPRRKKEEEKKKRSVEEEVVL